VSICAINSQVCRGTCTYIRKGSLLLEVTVSYFNVHLSLSVIVIAMQDSTSVHSIVCVEVCCSYQKFTKRLGQCTPAGAPATPSSQFEEARQATVAEAHRAEVVKRRMEELEEKKRQVVHDKEAALAALVVARNHPASGHLSWLMHRHSSGTKHRWHSSNHDTR
jgi:hypothetical protein